jgi:hypothetical protein
VRFVAWLKAGSAVFSVSWAHKRSGRMIVVNVPMDADAERLADAAARPEFIQLAAISRAQQFAREFSEMTT